MRRVFINKWFILASLLTISLSCFSFVAYQDMDTPCTLSRENDRKPANGTEKVDFLWDMVTRQLPTVSFQ
jgi:hypothetical protein